jgi:hypothetical protein
MAARPPTALEDDPPPPPPPAKAWRDVVARHPLPHPKPKTGANTARTHRMTWRDVVARHPLPHPKGTGANTAKGNGKPVQLSGPPPPWANGKNDGKGKLNTAKGKGKLDEQNTATGKGKLDEQDEAMLSEVSEEVDGTDEEEAMLSEVSEEEG